MEKHNGRFQKGHKFGKGRPKGSGRIPRCAEWADKYGIEFLERVAEGKEKDIGPWGKIVPAGLSIRVDCARYLIDQGKGKAPIGLEVTGNGKSVGAYFSVLEIRAVEEGDPESSSKMGE